MSLRTKSFLLLWKHEPGEPKQVKENRERLLAAVAGFKHKFNMTVYAYTALNIHHIQKYM